MEENNYIRSIFSKFIKGRHSPKELDDLLRYFGESSEQEMRQMIREELETPDDDHAITPSEKQALNRIDQQVHAHVARSSVQDEGGSGRLIRQQSIYRWIAVAAIFLVCTWGRYYFYMHRVEIPDAEQVSPVLHDLDPGGNRATLTLADGRTVVLNEDQGSIVMGSDGVTYTDGTIVVGLSADVGERLNVIQTPRGGQYRIVLPDGTKVWLNAASSLRYPGQFVGKERRVELDGEGYFEVVKNAKQKFKVVCRGQEVEVLGTQFNINAYTDEPHVKTTLVEGRVRVASLESKEIAQLFPGQQSVLTKNVFEIDQVDVSTSIGWKDNDFIFKGQDLRTTMRQLARWYDVEVRYAPNAPLHLKIGGLVSRNNRLSSVLKAMASTNSVQFDFDGKTILVKPVNN